MWQFVTDIFAGIRSVRRSPSTAALASIAVAFGIAAPTTMYSVVRGMLRDLPVHEGERVVYLTNSDSRTGERDLGVSPAELGVWRSGLQAVGEIGAFRLAPVSVAGVGGHAERRSAARMEAGAFAILRVRPALGEVFTAADEITGATETVVISDDLWRVRFGADSGVIGGLIRVDGSAARIVGVMPRGFRFPFKEDLWLPLAPVDGADTVRTLQVFGRLAAGATLERARLELATLGGRTGAARAERGRVTPLVMPYKENQIEPSDRVLFRAMLGVAMLLLLVACMNVASLLTVRVTSRANAIGIKRALGASPTRVMRETLGEVVAIAAAGGTLGVLLAWRGVTIFYERLRDDIPNFWMVMRVDWAVLGVAALLVVLATVAAGLGPALHAARIAPGGMLRESSRGGTSRRSSRVTRTVVLVEIACSCVVLIVAALMTTGVRRQTTGTLAIDAGGVLTARLILAGADSTDAANRAHRASLLDGIAALPAVSEVALSSAVPGLGGARARMTVHPERDPADGPEVGVTTSTPAFFDLVGVELLAGRAFRDTDDSDAPPVAVLTRSAVARHFPTGGAVGAEVRISGSGVPARAVIVGVVDDLGSISQDPVRREVVFLPLAQNPTTSAVLLVRTQGDPMTSAEALRTRIAEVDSDLPVQGLALLTDELRGARRPARLLASLFATFGSAGLLLACLGLYGTVAFGLGLRRREFGIRSALGAGPLRLSALALRGGLVQAVAGAALGVGLAVLLAPPLENLFFGASAHDPVVYGAVVAAFLATTVGATLRPVLRAARTDPAVAMRVE